MVLISAWSNDASSKISREFLLLFLTPRGRSEHLKYRKYTLLSTNHFFKL